MHSRPQARVGRMVAIGGLPVVDREPLLVDDDPLFCTFADGSGPEMFY